jgi:hypothetical protein
LRHGERIGHQMDIETAWKVRNQWDTIGISSSL